MYISVEITVHSTSYNEPHEIKQTLHFLWIHIYFYVFYCRQIGEPEFSRVHSYSSVKFYS